MQAAYYEQTGPASTVLKVGDLPDPQPGPGEVRVRLAWSGVNPSDVKARSGARSPDMPFPKVIPHSDGMGVIDAVGSGVPSSRIGERVWLWNAAWSRPFGTAAQSICLPEAQAVLLPKQVPDEAGACLGIPALTALHAVLTEGGVQGQRVLVAGGAGAVGHYAIQFARLLGARQVISTVSSAEKAALAQAAGTDVTVNYRSEPVAERVLEATQGEGVDRVIEVDIAANAALNLAVVRPNGLWVVYGSGAREVSLPFFPMIARNVGLRFFIVYNLNEDDRRRAIAVLTDFLRTDRLQHHIGLRLPLAQVAKAHEAVESGQVVGNVVLSTG
ncbi:NADPH:quinone reductase [Curvibacter sp. HBC28]|uniref:NADPH:quinone reductase n=1 Tax=Curvibacter microcysteis TaxID=3026419 RepID=A0ABT5MIK3_9BURK|nr:NADPH:quinone reductase [Curvibacter sp. HBC28]MDD0815824.1 NADPH:quinone reductase [Curvibacter sp. HBC28]